MKVIQFLKYRKVFGVLSVALILGMLAVTIARGGFNLGLDFQAGISQRVEISPAGAKAPIDQIRTALRGIDGAQIQVVGNPADQEYGIKVKQQGNEKTFSDEMTRKITGALGDAFGAGNVKLLQTEYVGPRFSADLASQAAFLTIFAVLLILLYSWFRFKLEYAVAAITALIHDALFMVGFIGAFQLEVTTATVAAVLTIIGYSINDTIVIFDRIRENNALMRESPFPVIINTSLTQSMGRTAITSMTTLLAVAAIFIFATGDVQQFALNMIVGIIVGTYSSIYIATNVLHFWEDALRKARRKRDAKLGGAAPEAKKAAVPLEEPAAVPEEPETAQEDAAETVPSRRDGGRVRLSREERRRKAKKS